MASPSLAGSPHTVVPPPQVVATAVTSADRLLQVPVPPRCVPNVYCMSACLPICLPVCLSVCLLTLNEPVVPAPDW